VVAGDVTAPQGSTPEVPVTVTSDAGTPSGTVRVLDASDHEIGTGTLTDGMVTVSVDTSGLAAGANTVTVSYQGAANFATSTKTITITITSTTKVATVTAPDVSTTYGRSVRLPITVAGVLGSPTPTGQVRVMYGSTLLGSAKLKAGRGQVTLGATSLDPGAHALSLVYDGDSVYGPSTGTATVTVAKADATIYDNLQGQLKVGKPGPKLAVTVTAGSVTQTGTVTLVIAGQSYSQTLAGGKATIVLPTFTSPGSVPVTIEYSGSDVVDSATKTITLTVKGR
jgi:5'-nucleotidase